MSADNDNPFCGQPITSPQVCSIMRDINKIEALRIYDSTDVMFVLDTSGSMADVLALMRQNIASLFNAIRTNHPGAHVGISCIRDYTVRTQNYETYGTAPSAGLNIRCQPTDDLSTISSALNSLPAIAGYEDYRNALYLADEQVEWRTNANRLLVFIGDEEASQPAQVDYSGFWPTWEQSIAQANDNFICAVFFCPHNVYGNSSALIELLNSTYEAGASGTGGTFIRTADDDAMYSALEELLGENLFFKETEFFSYPTDTTRVSLGVPDHGVTIPEDLALSGTPLRAKTILEMRRAVERMAASRKIKNGTDTVYWAYLWFAVNFVRNDHYGATTFTTTWTRSETELVGTQPLDIEIGEVYEAVALLKQWTGVT